MNKKVTNRLVAVGAVAIEQQHTNTIIYFYYKYRNNLFVEGRTVVLAADLVKSINHKVGTRLYAL